MLKCMECKHELLLDHVVEKEDKKYYWYTCVNPKCSRKGIAFSPTQGETEAKITAGQAVF